MGCGIAVDRGMGKPDDAARVNHLGALSFALFPPAFERFQELCGPHGFDYP